MKKVCKKCGKSKDPSMFNRHKASKDGLQGYCKKCMLDYHKEWDKNRDMSSGVVKDSIEREEARAALNRALRKGLIEKLKCRVCGDEKTQGHHENYEKPFDVIWLCGFHYLVRHLEISREVEMSVILPYV